MIKLLLTDSGLKNPSIHNALLDLLGKPINECQALGIPTAGYGHPYGSPFGAYKFITGQDNNPMVNLGWKSVGVLELTALPSIDRERWVRWVQDTDVFLANGGDALYLAHWMRESGLAELIKNSNEKVWVGLSGGSMVMAPSIGKFFVGWNPPSGKDEALGWVDFAIFPHMGHPMCPENTEAAADTWAEKMGIPAYAMDDQTAIKIVDGKVEVISEGHWNKYNI